MASTHVWFGLDWFQGENGLDYFGLVLFAFLHGLHMTGSYSVQNSVTRTTRGPHVKSRTFEIKPRIHTIKFYQN